jgi:hypothetical protein
MTETFHGDDYRASWIWGWVFAVPFLFFFFGHGSLRERLMVTPLQVATIFILIVFPSIGLWFLILPIRRVDIVDDQTLQFRTKKTVDTISVTAVTRLVLTDVDHDYYRIKVITESKAWRWRSTGVDADRFANAMLAINPQLPITRREVTND